MTVPSDSVVLRVMTNSSSGTPARSASSLFTLATSPNIRRRMNQDRLLLMSWVYLVKASNVGVGCGLE